jgi:4-hydroxy-3-polyprenylbenzoate decarboxylase
MTREEALKSLRTTLEWLGPEVKRVKAPVDPVLEATAINKAFDDGPAFLMENVVGYPNARLIASLWGRRDRLCKLLGAKDMADTKFKILDAIKHPIPPVEVRNAPSQEVVIPKSDVDPFSILPMVQHTEEDGGRFFGSGVHYIRGAIAEGGSQLSFYRMSFRGRDFASINMVPGGHGDQLADRNYTARIPCTVNVSPPPMVEYMGMAFLNAAIFPTVDDEVGTAGALGGAPVEIVKAKTVDAYAMANAEYVIEGHIVPSQRVWETEEAERLGQQGVANFHPEWARYMGRAYRARRFEVTAITHRRDKPIYFVPHLGSMWQWIPWAAVNYYELAERLAPGFVQDVTAHTSLMMWGGIVMQVKKRRRSDEGMQRNILSAVMGLARGMRLVIMVDEDIDIYQPEDVLWAIATRVNPHTDILYGAAGSKGQAYMPAERMAAGNQVSMFEGGIGIDATVPLEGREHFKRARYPVEKFDFRKWFSEAEIAEMKGMQCEYLRFMGDTGYA